MLISILIGIISLILEVILSNFLPYLNNNLSLFTPMFSIVSLFFIYSFFKKDKYRYFIFSFIFGFVYDLFFTNLLFFNGILFLAIAFLITLLYENLEINFLNIILEIVIIITVYELLTVFIILIFNLVPITPLKVLYKISHSLIINIIYGEILYFIIKHLPKKYRSLSIN
ncbi:rod shape-determining protein MreD [Candidatus Ruminimicrobium bovinum]|uniref:rod shape-determining protein MreD n=1 Tax=Candidatus Ruminimicrobium bovinum TaxID=3242779 RepID=UPI0039B83009